MSHPPVPARPSLLSSIVRSIGRPALVGVAAGALATVVLPATTAGAEDAPQSFHRTATYPVYKNLPKDVPASSTTVAEISDVSKDGKTLIYTDALGKRIGFLDISDPKAPVGAGSFSLATLGDVDDQPTSVAVVGSYVLVVVDTSESFTNPSGRLDVVRLSDSKRIRSIPLAGQPDSIDISADEQYAAIAIENQRDETFAPTGKAAGDLPQLPAGLVQVVDLAGKPDAWVTHRIDLVGSDGSALPSFVAAGLTEPTDPEPEYVSINSKNKLALTLQENNGIAIIDLKTRAIEKVFSAGKVTVSGIDAKKDGKISLTDTLTDIPREPDSIGWVDDTHVATANEGDWKGGSRGWTVFSATDGSVTWDAGNSFERLAVKHGLYNDDRAAKKGAEPEGLSIATIKGVRYAFVGSERSNFIAVYDISNPAAPTFKQILPATNGPEGILPIPGRNLLAVSSETDVPATNVRASVSLYELGDGPGTFPSIVADDVAGSPIGWSALGALSAKPGDAGTIYSAADTVLKPAQIYTVDVTKSPARITSALTVTEGGAPASLDVEGLYARPDGGFWLASEGATGAANKIYRTDAAGAIQQTVSLPTAVTDHIKNWGLEGVTATVDSQGAEHVWTVIQRQLWTNVNDQTETVDGDNIVRIGRYDVADGSWHWFGYELQSPKRDGADWVGLSEITAVDNDTFAVVERDKLNGPNARNKRIYTVDIPATDPPAGTLPILQKKLAIDVLPALEATNGWTQEKLEGFTIAADGALYGVTDNDGLKDSTGETVFLRLGQATQVFADQLRSTTTLSVPASGVFGQSTTATVSVTGGAGIAPTGLVRIKDGSTVVGQGAVQGGTARVTLTGLRVGVRSLVAEYVGDARTVAGSSTPVGLTVSKGATTTSLSVAKTSVRKGKKVTAKVTVAGAGFAPTGRVQIKDGSKVVKTFHVTGGTRSVSVTLKSTGRRSLKAYYLGSDSAEASRSATDKVRVTKK